MCEVRAIMAKQEQYVRGWMLLNPNDPHYTEMAQYALDLTRLGCSHWDHCTECQRGPVEVPA